MDDLLFLCHRIPFPPDKGDKIRSFHILDHLAARYRVHLGCFYDNPADARHIDALKRRCASVFCLPLARARARVKSLTALVAGGSLTEAYFRDPRLAAWVAETMAARKPTRIFVFGSAMAPYALPHRAAMRVFDMVDVDSEKWGAYAQARPWPLSWLYAREQRTLLALERMAAAAFDWTLLVSRMEAELFRRLAPEAAERIVALRNGVDTAYFDPGRNYARPFADGASAIVFTGAMDYWPNIQAVEWFASAVMPLISGRDPRLEFWIVGANPGPAVRRLARDPAIRVTGRVEDTRPYLAHAAAIVAPLQVARGIQNKVLEAMAMARPVVATPEAAEGIVDEGAEELIVRAGKADFAEGIRRAMSDRGASTGRKARTLVEARFQWSQSWELLDPLLAADGPAPRETRAPSRIRPGVSASALER